MTEIPGPIVEQTIAAKPEFDGGAFTISAFSPSPEGFQIYTRNTLGRTEGIASNHLDPGRDASVGNARDALWSAMLSGASADDVAFFEKKREKLRRKLGHNASKLRGAYQGERGELSFNGVDILQEARTAWKRAKAKGADAEEVAALESKFYEERAKYQAKGKKVGFRNISIEGNIITVDTKIVSFPMYNEFSSPTDAHEISDLSDLAATATIVETADGKLVIQHRAVAKQRLTETGLSRGNASYTDIPGTSVGGLLDATFDSSDRKQGRTDPVDTKEVNRQNLKETGEEIGLGEEDFDSIKILGLSDDKIKTHKTLLMSGKSKLTAEELRETSRNSARNVNLGDADFDEKFEFIEASPNAIKTLLTEVKCPLAADHAAAFVATGYAMVLQKEGKTAADAWKTDLEQGIQRNYEDINRRVKEFYDMHPEALMQVPERFWGKNIPARRLQSYTPAYAPDEQGLPSFEDVMVEAGLIAETRKVVPEVLMFDVDGPLSDPVEKRIKYDELVTALSDRLTAGEPLFLNTGRSTEWIMERVTPLIREQVQDPVILKNLVIIGEKGGTWVTFNDKGEAQHGKSKAITIDDKVMQAGRRLVEEKYSDSMFFDTTKQTMMSIEMHDGFVDKVFKQQQEALVEDLNNLLGELGIDSTYKVDPTTIATDVESPYVGKALGADRCLQWLRDNNIKVGRFITFGDSISDLEMADELQRKGVPVEFVFVGDAQKYSDALAAGTVKDPTIIRNVGGFSKGTRDYLLNRSKDQV